MKWALVIAVWLVGTAGASAQSGIRWKSWQPGDAPVAGISNAANRKTPGRLHVLAEFPGAITAGQVAAVRARGAVIVQYAPERGLVLSTPDDFDWAGVGVSWAATLRPRDKLSPLLDLSSRAPMPGEYVVEFYPDVDMGDARSIVVESGLRMIDSSDLLDRHLLVSGSRVQLLRLARWDEVAYVFPASRDLVEGKRVNACAGALAELGSVSQAVPTVGHGWGGPGMSVVELSYVFAAMTEQLPKDAAQGEIVRAFTEWTKHAKLKFTPSQNMAGARAIMVFFASGKHGDPYPFDGKRGMLAHTFYPYPLNPEPIAGDMHLDADESWHLGTDTDLFSVALHETGHALGLGHSDDPRDVMYPYYRRVTELSPGDIAGILQLYAKQDGNPAAPTPEPPVQEALTIAVNSAPASVATPALMLQGTVSGGSGAVQVWWQSDHNASGAAEGSRSWVIPAIPLSVGANAITITATDAQRHAATVTIVVMRTGTAPADTTAPALTITTPASNNVSTSAPSIVFSGTARDAGGIAVVTWSTSGGATGVAQGTDSWSAAAIPLLVGTNTVTIRAADRAGNIAWRAVTVTRRAAAP